MSDDKAAVQPESEESKVGPNGDPKGDSIPGGKADAVQPDIEAGTGAPLTDADLADALAGTQDAGDEAPALDEVASLQAQLEQANAKASEKMDLALRTQAEVENLRKRQSKELEKAHKFALKDIADALLPVRDTLELGVAAAEGEQADLQKVVEGTELTLKMLTQALEKFNIVEVNPIGEKFDPDLHQAISMQEGTDKPVDTVLTVMQKGYTLNERLLRPAMVVIAK